MDVFVGNGNPNEPVLMLEELTPSHRRILTECYLILTVPHIVRIGNMTIADAAAGILA